MNILINLSKSELMYDVMNDTHLVGQAKASQGATPEASYNLQADEAAHESKLLRSMQLAIEAIKQGISQFLNDVTATSANNILMTTAEDLITITLNVSPRFNRALLPTMTGLAHRYVVNTMLFDWFVANEPTMAPKYGEIAKECMAGIQKSFIKLPPTRPIH